MDLGFGALWEWFAKYKSLQLVLGWAETNQVLAILLAIAVGLPLSFFGMWFASRSRLPVSVPFVRNVKSLTMFVVALIFLGMLGMAGVVLWQEIQMGQG